MNPTARMLHDLRVLRRDAVGCLSVAIDYDDDDEMEAYRAEIAALNAAIKVALFQAAFGR